MVGVNGSGKSTFLKLAVGLLKPQSGKIIHQVTEKRSPRIAFHQQDVHIASQLPLSVEELVFMGRVDKERTFFTKKDKQIVMQSMEQSNVHMFAKKCVHLLSRGQFQRVLIARLLAAEPDIIVMDEPEKFLDVIARDDLIALIQKLNKTITFLISSHDFDFIFSLAQRIICLTNPIHNQEDHKFLEFLQKQNSGIKIEHLSSKHEGQ